MVSEYATTITTFIAGEVNRRWPGEKITVAMMNNNRRVVVDIKGKSHSEIDVPPVRDCCAGHFTHDTAALVWGLKDELESLDLVNLI